MDVATDITNANMLPARLPKGFELEGYVVDGWLRDGGMAAIYRARRSSDDRRVALKLQLPSTAHDEAIGARFDLEAELMRRTADGTHVVELLDAGVLDDGRRFLMMEWVDGEDLEELLDFSRNQDQRLSLTRACRIGRDIMRGLAELHGHGVVHLDLKPANVMVGHRDDGGDAVKLVDFGIAADLKEKAAAPAAGDAGGGKKKGVMGTSAYMPPEQVAGEASNPSFDLYAWGVLMFEVLSGSCLPPDGWSVETLPRLETLRRGVPGELVGLVRSCMDGDPQRRPESAEGVVRALGRIIRMLESSGGQRAMREEDVPVRTGGTQVAVRSEMFAAVGVPGAAHVATAAEVAAAAGGAGADLAGAIDVPEAAGVPGMPEQRPQSGVVAATGGAGSGPVPASSAAAGRPESGVMAAAGGRDSGVVVAAAVSSGEAQVSGVMAAAGVQDSGAVAAAMVPSGVQASGVMAAAGARESGAVAAAMASSGAHVSGVMAAAAVLESVGAATPARTGDTEIVQTGGLQAALREREQTPARTGQTEVVLTHEEVLRRSGIVAMPTAEMIAEAMERLAATDEVEEEVRGRRLRGRWLKFGSAAAVVLLAGVAWLGLRSKGDDDGYETLPADERSGAMVETAAEGRQRELMNRGGYEQPDGTAMNEEIVPDLGAPQEGALSDAAKAGGGDAASTESGGRGRDVSASSARGKSGHTSGPNDQECAKMRVAALSAKSLRSWDRVLQATSKRSCWAAGELRIERVRLRVEAYAEQGMFAKCVKEGKKSNDREVLARVGLCRKRVGG
ncbi:serine/threonine protein kinase [Paraliomyxa miuraensis]|uniref:serine/threonine protein kinase n=1 Tax=Paraliomyxa miuraensis TaxID=376150 RepID=UPI002251ECEB|nr:serine/threonine-protein kinase [Paraliomyxa miuraensis]MCX4247873.1 protein kinase [Paraliomyxa miuraensis]